MRRTVKFWRMPEPFLAVTVPSNIWVRVLSPSSTLTEMRTVSPTLNAGTSFFVCSASSALSNACIFFFLFLDKIRPPLQRSFDGLLLTPIGDLLMVPRQQYLGDLEAPVHRWAGIMRVF